MTGLGGGSLSLSLRQPWGSRDSWEVVPTSPGHHMPHTDTASAPRALTLRGHTSLLCLQTGTHTAGCPSPLSLRARGCRRHCTQWVPCPARPPGLSSCVLWEFGGGAHTGPPPRGSRPAGGSKNGSHRDPAIHSDLRTAVLRLLQTSWGRGGRDTDVKC